MFGLTTTAKLRAAEDAALQMHRENSGLRADVRAAEAAYEKQRDATASLRLKYDELYAEMLAARAERDEARAIIAARREKAKRNLRQFRTTQASIGTA